MDLTHWKQIDQYCWSYSDAGSFPLIAYGDQQCLLRMHPQVLEQAWTLSQLPGLSTPVTLLPDAHPGFAMPNGCVVGFDANHGGAILSGDIHLDHAYGVRCLKTGLQLSQLEPQLESLSETLQSGLAAGLIQRGLAHCNQDSFDLMLRSGAHWAVEEGWGFLEDLQ
ncbi:RtcB family protein, partial [Vulcanococcus sp. CPBay_Sum15L08_68]